MLIVAVAVFPAASLAVAVQMLVVSTVTVGAVNVVFEKTPPFVQVTVGPLVTPTLSEAVTMIVPVPPEVRVKVSGEKATVGAVVSTVGVGTTVVVEPELELPPHADRISAEMQAVAVRVWCFIITSLDLVKSWVSIVASSCNSPV